MSHLSKDAGIRSSPDYGHPAPNRQAGTERWVIRPQAVKEGVVEIQGDQRERLKAALEALGFTVKLAGG